MPHAPVNGIDLYYESHGEGPAVVFAHGRGGNHMSWWQQVPTFSRRYRCITFDHRGWGQSRDLPQGPGRAAFVDDLRALLDHLGIRETYLVAQSMGGWACLGFAVAHPERTRGLVLADTTGGISEPSLIAAIKAHGPAPTSMLDRVVAPSFRTSDPERTFLYGQINALNPGPEPVVSILTAGGGPMAKDLARLDVPTLFIVGTEDVLTRPHILEQCAAMIPGARLEHVPGAGHSVYWEKPERFNQLVGEFFAGLEAATGSRLAR